jgi:hypothetical protein
MKTFLFNLFLMTTFNAYSQSFPQGLFHNNNTFPITKSIDAAFRFDLDQGYPPLIISDFNWNFSNSKSYTIQFYFQVNNYWPTETNYTIPLLGFSDSNLTSNRYFLSNPTKFIYYKIQNLYSTSKRKRINHLFSVVGENHFDNTYKSNNGFSTDNGYQITTTYDGLEWKNYVNGSYLNTISNNNSIWNGSGNLIFGNLTYDNTGPVTSKIDEVRFWSKTLTSDEIADNWNKSLIGNEDSLKVYYHFNNQGYPNRNNGNINYLFDATLNKYKAKFINFRLNPSEYANQSNFVSPINNFILIDSVIFSVDANNIDCFPGTGYNNNPNNNILYYDISSKRNNMKFFYDENFTSTAIILPNADGGRSIRLNNLYGKSVLNSTITGAVPLSFETWIKFKSINEIQTLVTIGNNTDRNQFELTKNNNKLQINIGNNHTLTSNRNINLNTWYHIVCTYKDKFYIIYINGIYDNAGYIDPEYYNYHDIISGYMPLPQDIINTPIFIGKSKQPVNINIGILNLYNKALSEIEVLKIYNMTKSRFGY